MVRPTTLLFPEDLHVRLRERAAGQGISIGEFVRRAVRRALDPKGALRPPARGERRQGRSLARWTSTCPRPPAPSPMRASVAGPPRWRMPMKVLIDTRVWVLALRAGVAPAPADATAGYSSGAQARSSDSGSPHWKHSSLGSSDEVIARPQTPISSSGKLAALDSISRNTRSSPGVWGK